VAQLSQASKAPKRCWTVRVTGLNRYSSKRRIHGKANPARHSCAERESAEPAAVVRPTATWHISAGKQELLTTGAIRGTQLGHRVCDTHMTGAIDTAPHQAIGDKIADSTSSGTTQRAQCPTQPGQAMRSR